MRPKKLKKTKKNCKKEKKITFSSNFFGFLKFFIENIMITIEEQKPKIKE